MSACLYVSLSLSLSVSRSVSLSVSLCLSMDTLQVGSSLFSFFLEGMIDGSKSVAEKWVALSVLPSEKNFVMRKNSHTL